MLKKHNLGLVIAKVSLVLLAVIGWQWYANGDLLRPEPTQQLEQPHQPQQLRQEASDSDISPLGEQLQQLQPQPSASLAPIPQQKILLGGTQVFQTFNNCGPASMSMALSHFDITISQQRLGQDLRPYQHPTGDNDDKSVTIDEIAAQADEYGLVAYHRPAGDVAIMQHFIANDMPIVTRTLLTTGDDIGHYRVVKGYDQATRELIQDDSLQGADLRFSHDEFNALWEPYNNEFLVLVPPEKTDLAEVILASYGIANEQLAWQRALDRAETVAAREPSNFYARLNQSVAHYHLGNYQESIEAYEAVASQLPFRTLWYQIEPILAYYQAGQYQEALDLSDQILSNQNRAFSELYYVKGLVYEQQGQANLAQEQFDLADLYNPTGSWKANVTE